MIDPRAGASLFESSPIQIVKPLGTQLEIELDLNRRGVEHEVVLLEAESETAIHRTHRRYFEDLRTLVQTTAELLPIVVHEL